MCMGLTTRYARYARVSEKGEGRRRGKISKFNVEPENIFPNSHADQGDAFHGLPSSHTILLRCRIS